MKRCLRLLPLFCALVASLTLPGGAAATPGHFKSPGLRYAQTRLAGTNGYRIDISAVAGSLTVTAHKGNASVGYSFFHGGFDGDRLHARLPGVGWVFLHFQERARDHRPPADNCKGRATVIRRGIFRGRIRINGEGGYTRATSRHVIGKIVWEPPSTCRDRAAAEASGSSAAQMLTAAAPRGEGTVSFWADKWPSDGIFNSLFFNASLLRRRGPMLISNSVYASTEDTDKLTVATPPRSAGVDPPGPFTGTATFQQESPEEFSWTGDLAVELPGIGEVSLAGPKYASSLCVDRRCRGDLDEGGSTTIAVYAPRAAAPTPSPWRWPGSLR